MDIYEVMEQTLTYRYGYGVHRRHFGAHQTPPGTWRTLPFLAIVHPLETDYSFRIQETKVTYTARPGEMVLVPAHMPHQLEQSVAGLHSAAHIQYSLLGALDPLSLFRVPYHFAGRQTKEIRTTLFALITCNEEPATDLRLILQRKQLAFRLLHFILEHSSLKEEKAALLGRFSRIQPVLSYLEKNLGDPIARDDLAEIACLSPARFNYLFREITGVPPMKYLQNLRQKKAMELLGNTDLSIEQIATRIGYCDQFHFSRQFKKALGVNPSIYRSALRRQEWALMAQPTEGAQRIRNT